MKLTEQNYFSPEAEMYYMGSTQFKRFCDCEARAMAVLRGEHAEPVTDALLIGSYVDAYFSGTLEQFQAEHPEVFTRNGELLKKFQHAEYIAKRAERDEFFRRHLSGTPQVIMTGDICGVPFKVKVDSLLPYQTVDLKVMRDMSDVWIPGEGYTSFIEAWRYDIQGAIYQHIRTQNEKDRNTLLPFILAVITKESEPDIALVEIPQRILNDAMKLIVARVEHFHNIKLGLAEPSRCECCDYCRKTKVLTRVEVYDPLVQILGKE